MEWPACGSSKKIKKENLAADEHRKENMKNFIFGTMYINSAEDEHYPIEWFSQIKKCAPAAHHFSLLIDSSSPKEFVPSGMKYIKEIHSNLFTYPLFDFHVDIISFIDNIGHLAKNGRDGWGRAFCQGLKIAMDNYFDYVVHVESDLLARIDIENVIRFMQSKNIKAFTAVNYYNMIETGLMFFDVNYIKAVGLIEKYNYKEMGQSIFDHPENHLQKILGDDLYIARQIKGMRDDQKQLITDNISDMHFVTHASSDIRKAFMSLPVTEVFK